MNIETIWHQYRSSLKAFLHSKLSSHDDVEDLLQEILIKTHENLHTLQSETRIKAWVFQIANRAIIDFYRKRSHRQEISAEAYWQPDADSSLQDELVTCLAPFVAELSPESYELITRIDLQGESQKAYAEKLGISYSTLKSRVQKSRRELRALFEGCCDFAINQRGELIDCDAKKGDCNSC